MTRHGLRVEGFQSLGVENAPEEGIVGLKSNGAAEAEDIGFSIEVYGTTRQRRRETAVQKSFAKNEKLFQVDCGPILLRIPSIIEEEQPAYKKLADHAQQALNDAYRDC